MDRDGSYGCDCCYGDHHRGRCCPGWIHSDDPLAVQRCDDCGVYEDDTDAQQAHDRDCGCSLGRASGWYRSAHETYYVTADGAILMTAADGDEGKIPRLVNRMAAGAKWIDQTTIDPEMWRWTSRIEGWR